MRFLLPIALLVTGCGAADAVAAPASTDTPDPVKISLSLYVLDEVGGPEEELSSQRRLPEIEEVAARMKTIWGQAGIELSVLTIARIEVPSSVLNDLAVGDTTTFLQTAAQGRIVVPDPAIINGFYVRRIGTANGVAPRSSRVFFVADKPTVNDERVSSHEIGHILGLHHDLEDAERLMYSGTNGTFLTDEQITTARYSAQGILDGVR